MRSLKLIGLGFSVVLMACSGAKTTGDLPDSTWKGKMQEASTAMAELFPLMVSDRHFNNSDNFSKIDKSVRKLAQLTHEIGGEIERGSVAALDLDPSLRMYAMLIKKDFFTAIESMENGQRSYARVILRTAMETCVRCHTRGTWGPEFSTWSDNSQLTYLNDIERAELLTAVRRYDLALNIYRRILSNPELSRANIFQWEKAAKGALNIAVRVKQDRKLADEVIDLVQRNQKAALFLRRDAAEWKKSLDLWKQSADQKSKNGLEEARDLLKKAAQAQGYWIDMSSKYVLYLRASALLHDHLRSKIGQGEQAETYFLLGKSYEGIQEPGQANLNEMYFKACIMAFPHTKQAQACYDHFEESVFMSYLREGGMGISQGSQDYLDYLRGLSIP